MSELNVILLGPPGAGKGTQAERLQEDFDVGYVATGEMLRRQVAEGTELGNLAHSYMDKGELVPDDIIIESIIATVYREECADGFLLDGFPRTVAQAEALDVAMSRLGRRLTAVLLIEAPPEEIVRRLCGRRTCEKGHVYHLEMHPPQTEGVCDIDGTPLHQREDDHEDTIRKRLQVYQQQTAPLIAHYEDRGILLRFDGTRTPTEVHDHLRASIATLRLEDEV